VSATGKLDRPGGSLYFEVIDATPPWAGEAPLIVFHHGIGATAEVWAEWLPALLDRYRVARFDMLGFGRSGVPGPALLSLTVSNASHRGGSIQRAREWREFIRANGMAKWGEMMAPLRLDRDRVSPAQYRWFEEAQARCSADSVLDLADVLIGTDLSSDLGRIPVPTLLLAPGRSPFVPLAVMEAMHAGIAGSELQVFPDARHGLPCSHGPACGRALRAFLDRRAG